MEVNEHKFCKDYRKIVLLGLGLVFFLFGCGAGTCPTDSACGFASLSAGALDFGAKSFNSTSTSLVRITNSGKGTARELAGTVSGAFAFTGGSFPGTGGTCKNSLAPRSACELEIVFTAPPPPVSTQTSVVTVTYRAGKSLQTAVIPLTARGDNGTFNQARGFNGTVRALALTAQGLWVGGFFASHSSNRARSITRLASDTGAVASGFTGLAGDSGFDSTVFALTPATDLSGDVYVGGQFTSYNGTLSVNRVARLNGDGSLDTGFNTGSGAGAGFNATVRSLIPATDGSGDVYVGGQFTSYNGALNVNRVARLNSDGTLDTGFNIGSGAGAGFNNVVYCLAPATDLSGDVYVGGDFTAYNGTLNVNRIARLNSDGSLDTGFNIGSGAGAGLDGIAYSLAPASDGSGDVYVGGQFNSYNGTATVYFIARLNSDGSLDTGFNFGSGGFDSFVHSIAPASDGSGDVYVGGEFSGYDSTSNVNCIARLNSDGSLDTVFNTGSGAGAGFNGDVYYLTPATDGSGDVYAGGLFTSYNGTLNVNRIARLNSDGSLDTGFIAGSGAGAGLNGGVYSFARSIDLSGDIYVGGQFTSYNGALNVNRVARLNSDGSLDTGFNIGVGTGAGFNSMVLCLAPTTDGSGDIYVGGQFTSYNGALNVNRVARLNSDGSLDTGFNIGSGAGAGFNNSVNYVAPATDGSNDVYVGGNFTAYNGTLNVNRVVRLNSDGSLDAGFNIGSGAGAGFNIEVLFLALATDLSGDVYVAGQFTSYNGTLNVNRVARLNSDGSLDTGFNIGSGAGAGLNSIVFSITTTSDGSGDVYVGGDFTAYNGTLNVNRIARLNSDGSLDTGFDIGSGAGAGFNNTVIPIAPATDGSGDVYIGGNFTSYNGIANVNRVARLNIDGSLDTGFNTGGGAGAGLNFGAISIFPATDASGDVYIGGFFNSYNGSTQGSVSRISLTGSAD